LLVYKDSNGNPIANDGVSSEGLPVLEGEYKIYIAVPIGVNYYAITEADSGHVLTIIKVANDPIIYDRIPALTAEYDGLRHAATLMGVTNPDGVTVDYSIDNEQWYDYNDFVASYAPIDAGTYTIHYRLSKTDWPTGRDAYTVTITPQLEELTAVPTALGEPEQNSVEFNRIPAPASGRATQYGASLSASTPPNAWFDTTKVEGLQSGTEYYLWARSTPDANYADNATVNPTPIKTQEQPNTGGGGGGGGGTIIERGGGKSDNSYTHTFLGGDGKNVVIPYTLSKDGSVATLVTDDDLNALLIKNTSGDRLSISPTAREEDAEISGVTIPSPLVQLLAENHLGVSVQLVKSKVTLSSKAMVSAERQSGETGLTISVTLQSSGTAPLAVYSITISSGGKVIDSPGGGSIVVKLPAALSGIDGERDLTAYWQSGSNPSERLITVYDSKTDSIAFMTKHLSDFAISFDSWTNPFSDASESDWFYNALKFANRFGLVNGVSPTSFEPNGTMTRAMFTALLYRYAAPDMPTINGDSFSDVPESAWYGEAVAWASEIGIVSGIGEGKFGPGDPITREQAAVLLQRYAEVTPNSAAPKGSFTDAGAISDWAAEGVGWCYDFGIVSGYPDAELRPRNSLTRAEGMAMFSRFVSVSLTEPIFGREGGYGAARAPPL
jgi:hypothetical protein